MQNGLSEKLLASTPSPLGDDKVGTLSLGEVKFKAAIVGRVAGATGSVKVSSFKDAGDMDGVVDRRDELIEVWGREEADIAA